MRSRPIVVALGIALTALFIACALVPELIPSHRFLFLFFLLYCIFLPGYLLVARLLPWAAGFLRVLASFVMGTALCFAFLIVIAIFRWDIRLLGYCVPLVVLILLLLPSPMRRSEGAKSTAPCHPWPPTSGVERAVMIGLIVGVSILLLKTGDPFFYTSDSVDHMAYVRTISRSHEVFPEQWYYRNGGMLTHDIRRGILHSLWGTLNAFTGRNDVPTVWPFISVIGSVFFIIALFCAGSALFGVPAIGVVSAILFVFFYRHGLGGFELISMAYGFIFGKIFYVAGLAFIPRYMKRPEPGYLLLIVASFFAATGTHINMFFMVLFLLFVAALVAVAYERGAERIRILFKRILLLTCLVLATNLPYVVLRYIRDYAPSNPIYLHVQGILYFTDSIYVLNPTVFFGAMGTVGVLATISVVLLWKKMRIDEALHLLLFGIIAYYVLVFNPLWFPLIHKRMLFLIARFEALIPTAVVAAYLLFELWQWIWKRKNGLSHVRAVLALSAVALCLGYPLSRLPATFVYSKKSMERIIPRSYRNLNDLYKFINANCPPGKVFLSDVFTSFSLPGFTDEYVVCTLDQHSIPNDSTAETRISACRDFFLPSTSLRRMGQILDEYGAEYVAVNGRIPSDALALYWKPDPAAAHALTERLIRAAPAFEKLYEHDNCALFRFAAAGNSTSLSDVAGAMPFLGDSVSEPDLARCVESGQPGILIKSLNVSRDRMKRGDTLQVHITWVGREKRKLQRYMAYIRFDTDFPKNALYRESYGKLYRKALEKIKHERYRFRVDVLPMKGIRAPDTWPPLREVHDTVAVAVPRDIAAGTYSISVRVRIIPQFPNYYLRDFFTDRDYFSGVTLARVVIE